MAQVPECLREGETLLFSLCFWPLCWNFPRVKISAQPGEAWVAPDATPVTKWVQSISSRDLVAGSPILTFDLNDMIQSSFTTATPFWGNFSTVSKFERE